MVAVEVVAVAARPRPHRHLDRPARRPGLKVAPEVLGLVVAQETLELQGNTVCPSVVHHL